MQAARFMEEGNHQRKVQLFFTITLALLEHQILMVKEKCTPAALAADPKTDVEVMFRRITNAIKVCTVCDAVALDDLIERNIFRIIQNIQRQHTTLFSLF